MSKHTPGPWVIGVNTDTKDGSPVFKLHTLRSMSLCRIDANARLIAAAPDLVRDVRALIEILSLNLHLHELPIQDQDTLARARLTLAKATGGDK